MKQSVKALNKDGDCFKYIYTKFPGSTTIKTLQSATIKTCKRIYFS